MKNIKLFLFFLAFAVPVVCLAHPGHGKTNDNSITHYLLEPLHLLVSIIAVSGIFFLIRYLRKKTI